MTRPETTLRTLRAERAHQRGRERGIERERVSSMRLHRHIAVAVVAAIVFFWMTLTPISVGVYLVMVVALALVISSLARAADIHFGWAYGHLYRLPRRAALLDRFVARAEEALEVPHPEEEEPQVRILPPERPPRF